MKIVITGGPSAGKTTITEVVARTYHDTVKLVPEAASILFRGGFPRAAVGESLGYQQIAIFHVQRQLENMAMAHNNQLHLICDRGTLDGLAYWTDTEEQFFKQVQSTKKEELSHYDWVIELDTASPVYYSPTSLRTETFEQAQIVNQRLQAVWSEHPKYLHIANSIDFDQKLERVMGVIDMIFKGESVLNIRRELKEGRLC